MTVYLVGICRCSCSHVGLLLLTDFPKPAAGTAEWGGGPARLCCSASSCFCFLLLLCGRLEERPTAASTRAAGRTSRW